MSVTKPFDLEAEDEEFFLNQLTFRKTTGPIRDKGAHRKDIEFILQRFVKRKKYAAKFTTVIQRAYF